MKALKIFVLLLITFEIAVITVLVIGIYKNKKNLSGELISEPINKAEIVIKPDSELKYFYEKKPNTVVKSSKPSVPGGTYTINSDSLNERYNYQPQKDPSTFRIITLGDSFTEGLYVDTAKNWSEVLENKLNQNMQCSNIKKFEVINLGVVAYDIQYEVHRYALRGQKYNPDLLIWFTYVNDFTEIAEARNQLYDSYHKLFEKQNKYAKDELHHMAAMNASKDFNKMYTKSQVRDYAYKKMLDIHKYYHKKILLTSSSYITPEEKDVLSKFKSTASDRVGIFIQPPYPADAYIPGDEHPSVKGHAMIADDIYNYLIGNNYIPCKH